MSLPWELRRRGLKDSFRHDARVKDAIRKNLRELIAEESIITSDGQKSVRIPLRYLDQYRFKYGHPQRRVGQGAGEKGDIIGRRVGDSDIPGSDMPGNEPGEQVYDVEVPLEELTQMMLEDLALPWLQEKPARQIATTTYRFADIRRHGPLANLDKRRTLLANVRRNAARGKAKVGNVHEADLRFRVPDTEEGLHANAAVYMLLDRSGSMTTEKKYIAKSFFFWMVRFLQRKYRTVEMVFIAHDTEAAVVPEKDFFAISNRGGTLCSSAYRIAFEHLQQHHPAARWNNYLFHFSDGDNTPSDNQTCKELVETLLNHCTMVGYGEIRYHDAVGFYRQVGQTTYVPSSLQNVLNDVTSTRFLSVAIARREELYQVLQRFLEPREVVDV